MKLSFNHIANRFVIAIAAGTSCAIYWSTRVSLVNSVRRTSKLVSKLLVPGTSGALDLVGEEASYVGSIIIIDSNSG